MSHVCSISIQILDLDCLKKACKALGLEFREGQRNYKWFGKWVNDYNAPEAAVTQGFDPQTFGQSEHAIGIADNDTAYEVGVVKAKDGKGYSLLYDNFCRGYGLEEVIGKGACKLRQQYALEVAKKRMRKQGFRVQEKHEQNGVVRLVCTR